ncbi:MAG: EscF/YscF/HrpA family type III secretion system needle major subunit [Desulfovibrio sp.]|jgi:type III secretion protein F|nr:EscF/YscF/HrpA family type III secretion system needle major subunit [Desulfovibrio sp.]
MTVGLNFGQMFQSGTASISNKGAELQAKMDQISGQENLGPDELLSLQFEMGQYTALMEATSTVTKSVTEMLKSLAQRTG